MGRKVVRKEGGRERGRGGVYSAKPKAFLLISTCTGHAHSSLYKQWPQALCDEIKIIYFPGGDLPVKTPITKLLRAVSVLLLRASHGVL